VAVYVDGAENKFGRMIMCHMLADTVAELHEFAGRIGLKREWFQPVSRPHYDLSKTRRADAVNAGAIELGRHELVAMMKRQHTVWVAEYAAARERGQRYP
jgi:Protein of unknown function (DUF4031)